MIPGGDAETRDNPGKPGILGRYVSCAGYQLYERGVDLEVEGVRYIEMHCGPAAYVLRPPPSRGRDLELEGGVNACHVEYVYESRDSHVRGTE